MRCASSTGRRSGTWRIQVPTTRRVVAVADTETAIKGSGNIEPRPIASKHHRLSKPTRSIVRACVINVAPVKALPSGFVEGRITPSLIASPPPLRPQHVRHARMQSLLHRTPTRVTHPTYVHRSVAPDGDSPRGW